MRGLCSKQSALVAILILTGMLYPPGYQQADDPHSIPASHGLRAYIDPDTGQYARATEVPPHAELQAGISANAPGQKTLTEIRSAKAGGGFSINLQARFRPQRHNPDTIKGGS